MHVMPPRQRRKPCSARPPTHPRPSPLALPLPTHPRPPKPSLWPLTHVLVELAVLGQLREPGGQLHRQAAHRRLAQHLERAAVGGDVQAGAGALVHLGKDVLGHLGGGGRLEGACDEGGGLARRGPGTSMQGAAAVCAACAAGRRTYAWAPTSSAVASLVGMAAISFTSTLTSAWGKAAVDRRKGSRELTHARTHALRHLQCVDTSAQAVRPTPQPPPPPTHLSRPTAATAGPGGPWRWPGPCAAARR